MYFLIVILLLIVINLLVYKNGFPTENIKYLFFYLLAILYFIQNASGTLQVAALLWILRSDTLLCTINLAVLSLQVYMFGSKESFNSMGKLLYYKPNLSDINSPTIFVVNYPADYLEYSSMTLFPEKTSLIAFRGGANRMKSLFHSDQIIPVDLDKKNNFNHVQKEIEKKITKGYNIFVYPEKSFFKRRNINTLTQFRTGIFQIAKNLSVSITPVVIEHLKFKYGIVSSPVLLRKRKITVLEQITVNDAKKDSIECRRRMARSLKNL